MAACTSSNQISVDSSASSQTSGSRNKSYGSSGLPPMLVIDQVHLLPYGFESPILVLTHMPTLLTSEIIGPIFSLYGRLKVNVLLTRRDGLVGLIQFDRIGSARHAYSALQTMQLELEPDSRSNVKVEEKEVKTDMPSASTIYTLHLRFAQVPLKITPIKFRQIKPVQANPITRNDPSTHSLSGSSSSSHLPPLPSVTELSSSLSPSTVASSATTTSSSNPISTTDLPLSAPNPAAPIHQFPVPFATSPFAELMATGKLPEPSSPYFSIDIDCVASGPSHNDRSMAHISVVDQHLQVVFNMYVKPKKPVFSYLPALTGVSEEDLVNGISEEEALNLFRQTIPSNSVLVGQSTKNDVEWLHLVKGRDFIASIDLSFLYGSRHPTTNQVTRRFSLHHVAKALLGLELSSKQHHHPAMDAWISMQLYQLYQLLVDNRGQFERAKKLLSDLPVEPSFHQMHPVYEGVCMGNTNKCKCGAP